jgi:hypothetical protein
LLEGVDDKKKSLATLSNKFFEDTIAKVRKESIESKSLQLKLILCPKGYELIQVFCDVTVFCNSEFYRSQLIGGIKHGVLKNILEDSSLLSSIILALIWPPASTLGTNSYDNDTTRKVVEPNLGADTKYLYLDMITIIPRDNKDVGRYDMLKMSKNAIIVANYMVRLYLIVALRKLMKGTTSIYVGGTAAQMAAKSCLVNVKVFQGVAISLGNLEHFSDVRTTCGYHPSSPLYCPDDVTINRVDGAMKIMLFVHHNPSTVCTLSSMTSNVDIGPLLKSAVAPIDWKRGNRRIRLRFPTPDELKLGVEMGVEPGWGVRKTEQGIYFFYGPNGEKITSLQAFRILYPSWTWGLNLPTEEDMKFTDAMKLPEGWWVKYKFGNYYFYGPKEGDYVENISVFKKKFPEWEMP